MCPTRIRVIRMKMISNLKKEKSIAKNCGEMEANTILKNGRGSKSKKSRKKFLFLNLFAFIGFVLILLSCGDSDGTKAAKDYCKCFKKDIGDFSWEEVEYCYEKFNRKYNKYVDVKEGMFKNEKFKKDFIEEIKENCSWSLGKEIEEKWKSNSRVVNNNIGNKKNPNYGKTFYENITEVPEFNLWEIGGGSLLWDENGYNYDFRATYATDESNKRVFILEGKTENGWKILDVLNIELKKNEWLCSNVSHNGSYNYHIIAISEQSKVVKAWGFNLKIGKIEKIENLKGMNCSEG